MKNGNDDSKAIQMELVYVIGPEYTVEQYLSRCVESIRNQTYRNIESILVDDGSPDACGSICDRYQREDKRITVIHKKNGGLSSARNAGLKIATGSYITFIDSDDWVTSDMIQYMMEQMLANQSDIVSVSYVLAKDDRQSVSAASEVSVMDRDQALEYFFDIGMRSRISDYPACAKLYKRELFKEIKFPEGTLYEDYTTVVELILKCNVYVKSTKECYFYYQGGTSIIRSAYNKQHDQLISQCEKVCNLVKDKNPTIRNLAFERLARSYLALIIKISVYGFDTSIQASERKMITRYFTGKVRSGYRTLISSHMPLSRKILLMIICIDYRPLCVLRWFMK